MAKKIDKNHLKLASNRQNQQISLNIFKIYLTPEIWVFIPFLCHCFPNFRKLRDFFENVERFSVKTRLNLPAAYSVYVFLFSLMLIQYEDHQNYRIEFAENSYFSSISQQISADQMIKDTRSEHKFLLVLLTSEKRSS